MHIVSQHCVPYAIPFDAPSEGDPLKLSSLYLVWEN